VPHVVRRPDCCVADVVGDVPEWRPVLVGPVERQVGSRCRQGDFADDGKAAQYYVAGYQQSVESCHDPVGVA
jgi:hypothetical protein